LTDSIFTNRADLESGAKAMAAGKALEWVEQYCRLTGIDLEPAS
jgi:hypothetical protein